MTVSRDAMIRQIRQYQIDRLSTDDPKTRDLLRALVVHLEGTLAGLRQA